MAYGDTITRLGKIVSMRSGVDIDGDFVHPWKRMKDAQMFGCSGEHRRRDAVRMFDVIKLKRIRETLFLQTRHIQHIGLSDGVLQGRNFLHGQPSVRRRK